MSISKMQPSGSIRYVSQLVQQSLPDFHYGEGQIYYIDLFQNQIPPPETMWTRTTTIFPFQFSDYETAETMKFWHNTCFGISRKNILQLIGLAISNEDSKSVLIHTERVNRSVFEWAEQEQSLLNQRNSSNPANPANPSNQHTCACNPANQHTCALLTADHLLPSEAFGQVMRGILEGINQASNLNADAANITSKSTFLVAGVAKVSFLIKKEKVRYQLNPRHPLHQFTKMISELARTAPLPSSELYWFLYLIDTNYDDQEFCEELPTHPSLYEISTRLQFRCKVSKHLSALRAQNRTEYNKIEITFRRLEGEIIIYKNKNEPHCSKGPYSQFLWKTHIEGFEQNCPYRKALTPEPRARAWSPALGGPTWTPPAPGGPTWTPPAPGGLAWMPLAPGGPAWTPPTPGGPALKRGRTCLPTTLGAQAWTPTTPGALAWTPPTLGPQLGHQHLGPQPRLQHLWPQHGHQQHPGPQHGYQEHPGPQHGHQHLGPQHGYQQHLGPQQHPWMLAPRAPASIPTHQAPASIPAPVANYSAHYSKDALDFVRYCRNMAQHPDNLKEQDLESKFTNIWKEYIPCLHEALRIHKQLPKVYDKKDSI